MKDMIFALESGTVWAANDDDKMAYLWLMPEDEDIFLYDVRFAEIYISQERVAWCHCEGIDLRVIYALVPEDPNRQRLKGMHCYRFVDSFSAAKFVLVWGGEVMERSL